MHPCTQHTHTTHRPHTPTHTRHPTLRLTLPSSTFACRLRGHVHMRHRPSAPHVTRSTLSLLSSSPPHTPAPPCTDISVPLCPSPDLCQPHRILSMQPAAPSTLLTRRRCSRTPPPSSAPVGRWPAPARPPAPPPPAAAPLVRVRVRVRARV